MTHPAQKKSAVEHPASETAADRRREKRFSSQRATASLFLRDQDHAAPVQVVDVSRDGMGLRLGMQVAVGSLVEVWLENFGVKGTIRFCRPTEDGAYDAGLEILSDLEGKAPPPFPAESDALSVGQLSTQPQSLRSTEGPARAHITVRMEFAAQAAIDCILLGIADGYMHVSAECGIRASTSLTARFNQ